MDEGMLAVLASEELWPSSESINDVLAEAYALRKTPMAERRERQYYAASRALAPVPSRPSKTVRRCASEELRAA